MMHLDDVAQLVTTTLTVSYATRNRLEAYLVGVTSFDAVLNELMDRVPVERFTSRRVSRLTRSPGARRNGHASRHALRSAIRGGPRGASDNT